MPAARSYYLFGMNHDFHGAVAFVERIGMSTFLQFDAAEADFAVDDSERDRLQAAVLAGAVDAQPAVNLEHRAVPAAFQEGPVPREEIALAEVEPDALVRTGIDIADVVVGVGPDHHDRKRAALAGIVDAEQAEGLRIAALDTVGGANDENLRCFPPAIGSSAADHCHT